MKPKFALDLSHEGINLLRRSKGGWTLVGSVALDDPDMGKHLADIRRRAAELESGGLSCKIIIPNSQILYTTVEAPGPDDIAREVQIRAALDGLTPYPVGDLVFDWRADGKRARVAVLARETMDEAETFAVEHKFNPVSFVARPPSSGEFSGEPFFGKTRAATRILGPTERVEPDATPVPRRPPPIEPAPVIFADRNTYGTSETDRMPPREPRQGEIHRTPESGAPPDNRPDTRPDTRPAPAPRPAARDADDPFAELDALQAELSGDPDTAVPAFRSSATRSRARSSQPSGAQPSPPPLAPFPPTPDETGAVPPPPAPARKARSAAGETGRDGGKDSGKPGTPVSPAEPAEPARRARPPAPPAPASWTPPEAARSGALDTGHDDSVLPQDDLPAAPGVAFTSRRNGTGKSSETTATPTARAAPPARPAPPPDARAEARPTDAARSGGVGPAASKAADRAQAPAGAAPAAPPPPSRREMPPVDRRRAAMADALSRPLPGSSPKSATGEPAPAPQPRSQGKLAAVTGKVLGAAGGLRGIGRLRGARGTDQPKPGSSMDELMRGADASEARITPAQRAEDEPDLLAPGIVGADLPTADAAPARAAAAAAPAGNSAARPASAPTARPLEDEAPVDAPAKTADSIPARPASEPAAKPAAKPSAAPAPARTPASAGAIPAPPPLPAAGGGVSVGVPRPPGAAPKPAPKPAPARPAVVPANASAAEAFTVFGARRTQTARGGRRYLGIILVLLLLLAMAVIALWSSFFVDDGDTALFNPGGEITSSPGTGSADTAASPPQATAPVTEAVEAPPGEAPAESVGETVATATPQVLSPEDAEALYAQTGIWQRAPEPLAEPTNPALDLGEIGPPGSVPAGPRDAPRADTAEARIAAADPSAAPSPPARAGRANPVPPPPAETVFDLDENGLVRPSPQGTVSPSGIIVYDGAPPILPPSRPASIAPPESGDDGASLAPQPAPEAGPAPQPQDLAAPAPAPVAPVAPEAPLDTATAEPATDPATAPAAGAAAPDLGAIEAAVDAAVGEVTENFVGASELAVAESIKPTHRPADFDQIVRAATARAAAAPAPDPNPPAATTTPAIPTSASVATQATTPNALDLGQMNLLGISGPANARRALVRMANGRYVTVKVGDRLDGGRVTSITDDGLTYQKGTRTFTLQLLPLG